MKETKYDDKRVFHKAVRMALGKTQEWMANKLRVKRAIVVLYEKGDDCKLYSEEYQTKISTILSDEIDRQVNDRGKWYKDIINLKIAINTIDICKYNLKEQKKAHKNLLMHLFSEKKITPVIYIVKDPAFGDMELFKEDDSSE